MALHLATLLEVGLVGCGGGGVAAVSSNSDLSISPRSMQVDTNCTGCNATNAHGNRVHQFAASLKSGSAADVVWALSGGDPSAGPGAIDAKGQYVPPGYLTADREEVLVTATLQSDPSVHATSVLTVTPGFLQPLTPENVALGANGSVTMTGILAEAGGSTSIHFALSDTPTGSTGGQGSLNTPICVRAAKAFTSCSVTYSAPALVQGTAVTYVVATAGSSPAKIEAAVLLNSAEIMSNPAGHQGQLAAPMLLGSSGGNNHDFDVSGNTIVDCCSGTLGALVEDNGGKRYLLSNNHVLARSDQANVGDSVVQPGLIDNNCTPSGDGAGAVPVGALSQWLPLSSSQTNADAAIAEVASHSVDASGSILELGGRQPDGSLAAAPPGISSTGGRGEAAGLQLRIAKSGRTTGLTCGSVSAIDVDVSVDYFLDCAETKPYLTKIFTNQIGLSGNRLSDAGDSGSLVVDTENAEPVGLYFAGGLDTLGVGQGIANPVGDVLSELSAQAGGGKSFTVVGGVDHAVSCLSYGDRTMAAAQALALSEGQVARVQQTLAVARRLVNPAAGILGVAMGKSSDLPGEAAVIVYVNEGSENTVPTTLSGVRTVVIVSDARAVALGAAPMINSIANAPQLSTGVLTQAIVVKQQVARRLMQQTPAFFGVGVGQSLDNPTEAALVVYMDRKRVPAELPRTVNGLRVQYILMDRLHVTRSFVAPLAGRRHCRPHAEANGIEELDPAILANPRSLRLF